MSKEVWKALEGYDYLCEISNLGRFKRVEAFHEKLKGSITTGSKDSKGYRRVTMIKGGKPVYFKVHRLVARYFLEGYSEELTVNHKNFDKSDNRVCNLEVVTIKDNIYHYQNSKVQGESSSSRIGVFYHKNINKWVARVTHNKKRYNLGTFDTEVEAIQAMDNYKEGDIEVLNIGKGVLNKGKRKYSEEQVEKIKRDLDKIGFKKTLKLHSVGMGTLELIKKGEYFNER